jgi:hypothetical protein
MKAILLPGAFAVAVTGVALIPLLRRQGAGRRGPSSAESPGILPVTTGSLGVNQHRTRTPLAIGAPTLIRTQ